SSSFFTVVLCPAGSFIKHHNLNSVGLQEDRQTLQERKVQLLTLRVVGNEEKAVIVS
ncbi:hypothetical protein AMECASPLE_036995, partial [Ameca splendens]